MGSCRRMTSCVASVSAGASSDGATARTTARVGAPLMPPASSPATRRPSCVPVASRITTCERSGDALVRLAITIGTMAMTPKKSGASAVLSRYHFERTRSRYSRLMIAQSLAMSAHSRLDARRANRVEENAVQRGLHELEALDGGAGVDQLAEEKLRVGNRCELDLDGAIRIVDAFDERAIGEDLGDG